MSLHEAHLISFSHGMYGFWGLIILGGLLNQFLVAIGLRQAKQRTGDLEGSHESKDSSGAAFKEMVRWFQIHLTLRPLFGTSRSRLVLGFSVPTRMEALIICSYWALNLASCATAYHVFDGNVLYVHTPH